MNNKAARAMLTHWPWPMSVIICLPQQVPAIYEIEFTIYIPKHIFMKFVLLKLDIHKVVWNNENVDVYLNKNAN